SLPPRQRSVLANDFAMFAACLGRLEEARALQQLTITWAGSLADAVGVCAVLRNCTREALALGRVPEAAALAASAVVQGEPADGVEQQTYSLANRAAAAHILGDVTTARADFAAATALEGRSLVSLRGSRHTRHCLDLGELASARVLANHGLDRATNGGWNF